jgi:uncharacterized protein (TIGR00255 family)
MAEKPNQVRSMTAFSRGETDMPWGNIVWEIRSLNHRYLDTNIRLPDSMRTLEAAVREKLRKKLHRGKVDCTLYFHPSRDSGESIQIDSNVLQQYLDATKKISSTLETTAPLNPLDLLFKPGVIIEQELDLDEVCEHALELFDTTLDEHINSRQREGNELVGFINQRLDKISTSLDAIRPLIPKIIEAQKNKLLKRLEDIPADFDDSRLEQEITLLAQKLDVEEELDRLTTHIGEVQRVFGETGSIGRRLDFLMQEMNREANTLSSKSASSDTTLAAVDLKVLIEQIREQVQNIE